MKKCRDCSLELSFDEFHINLALPDGRAIRCKICVNAKARAERRARGIPARQKPEAPEGMKWCSRCKDFHPLSDFPKNRSTKDGLSDFCKAVMSEYDRKRDWYLKKYGITRETFIRQLIMQNSRCAICNKLLILGAKQKSIIPFLDHCHKTGRIRKILCQSCNFALGHAKENIYTVENLYSYLVSNGYPYHNNLRLRLNEAQIKLTDRKSGKRIVHRQKTALDRYTKVYALDTDIYDLMAAQQNGKCAGCEELLSAKKGYIDHCHTTNYIRGILCQNCNSTLGFADDSLQILQSLKEYLEQSCRDL